MGYLADDILNIRIPLGVLSTITSDNVPFHWTYTEQGAFKEVKVLTENTCNHCCVPVQYGKAAHRCG